MKRLRPFLLLLLLSVPGVAYSAPPIDGGISYNFEDADIRAVAKSVGRVTGKNFLLDPSVQGNVSMLVNDPVDAKTLYRHFKTILQVNGYVLIEGPDAVKIVAADKAADQGGNIRYQAKLKHADCRRVARILNEIAKRPGGEGQAEVARFKVIDDVYSNSLIIDCPIPDKGSITSLIKDLDKPLSLLSGTEVIKLHFARAPDLLPILKELEGEKKITVDDKANALIVSAPSEVLGAVHSVVKALDVRRPQVLIEAIIVEVANDKAAELGIQWQAESGHLFGASSFSMGGQPINKRSSPGVFADGATLGFYGLNLATLLRALESDSDSNLLSTPKLLTLDNEEASISVGQNVPFVTGSYVGSSGDGSKNPFQTIERHDVGVKLKVRPLINDGDTIRLDIDQEVSGIASSTEGGNIITNSRSINTQVLVENGKVLVLGGLIQDNLVNTEQKIPFLGHLPIIGAAFRYEKETKRKQNLMVFIRPTIIRDAVASQATTDAYYKGE